jgi:hypothetical protein
MDTDGHWFWWALTAAAVLWYTVVTGYVAVKGAMDIKSMLRRLAGQEHDEDVPAP